MQVLIDAGFDFQTRAVCNRTILHSAIHGEEKLILDLLGLEGARSIIDVEDNYGSTALDYAVMYDIKKIKVVLSRHHARRGSRKKIVWGMDRYKYFLILISCCVSNSFRRVL